jgi:Protein of unknown function (DUF3631)
MTFKSLSTLLPGFLRKPGKPKPTPVLTVTAPEPETAAMPEPEPPKPAKNQKMLDDICAFLARYLQCSQNQRTVLALWILHTWCFAAARSTPYLAIQSSRKLSGKTLCLRLLVKRIHSNPSQLPTFLLDESPATLGSRGRSRNPKLRAILVSGFQPGIGYSDRSVECTIFSPKAFASTGPLPEPLADCSIPIVLQQARVAQSETRRGGPPSASSDPAVADRGPQPSTSVGGERSELRREPASAGEIERFDYTAAQEEAKPLIAALQKWSQKNLAALKSVPVYKRKDFPEQLTSRGQDIVEPLLQLADTIGGDYPVRARQALVAMFDDENNADRAMRIQLLRDIRQCFEHHGWPEKLHTSVILAWLLALPFRPWDVDGPITDRTLARLLRPHDICSRSVRVGSVARGYRQKDFVEPWNHLLDNDENRVAQPPGSPTRTDVVRGGVEVPSPVSSQSTATPTVHSEISGSPARAGVARDGVAEIPNNHATCSTVADVKIDPRMKGILADHRNFYRQYPERDLKNARDIAVNSHHWPQPADDKGPADVIYTLDNGIQIPYTIVNRDPWNPKGIPSYHNKRERWPVLLSDDEKAQLAVARFDEIYLAARARREQSRTA